MKLETRKRAELRRLVFLISVSVSEASSSARERGWALNLFLNSEHVQVKEEALAFFVQFYFPKGLDFQILPTRLYCCDSAYLR